MVTYDNLMAALLFIMLFHFHYPWQIFRIIVINGFKSFFNAKSSSFELFSLSVWSLSNCLKAFEAVNLTALVLLAIKHDNAVIHTFLCHTFLHLFLRFIGHILFNNAICPNLFHNLSLTFQSSLTKPHFYLLCFTISVSLTV